MPPSESSWRRQRVGTQSGPSPAFRRSLGQASSASRARQNVFPRQFQSPRPSTRAGTQIPPSTPAPSSARPRTVGAQLLETPSVPIQRDEVEPDDDLCQVVMALDVKERGTVGCCYYAAEEERLYILEDVEQGGLEIIETLKLDIEPTVVLVSIRADQGPPEQGETGAADSDTQFQLPYHVDVRPSQEFSIQAAKTKLANLNLVSEDHELVRFLVPEDTFSREPGDGEEDLGYTGQQGRLLHLASSVDLENRVSIGCAGALLTYLQRKRSARYLQNDQEGSEYCMVRGITMLTLRGTMFINKDTLASLHIVQSESHPNAFNQGPGKSSHGAKESLSMYGLFQRFARTPQGKALLRQYFIRPSTEIEVINKRHNFISTFLRPENEAVVENLVKSLRGIKNLRPVMIHLRKGISSGNAKFKGFKSVVWASLIEFAFHAIDVHTSLREVSGGESLGVCAKALHKLDPNQLHQVGRAIHETVDLESSVEERRTVVKPRVNDELDKLKEMYNGMDSLLSHVAMNIAATLPPELDIQINVTYFPQLGFNIAMPLDENGRPLYDGGEEPWDEIFISENRVYFKDERMREMDENLGDMYGQICDMEIEIVYDLAQKILTYEPMLVEASDICGELDSLLALVQGASMYKLILPQITDENIIDIKGGRHLLHEMTVPSYVPNDTYIVGGPGLQESASGQGNDTSDGSRVHENQHGPSMLILTGPNYSGKSVYLKQVALIVHMAHVGSFVPADSAKIGLTDKILTRITTRETVTKIQSTFMTDLQQVSFALNHATNRSLLIIDEFGKGTESTDGAGLACGLFDHLLSLGDESPKVLAATHFHEIFENGFLPERPELQFGHMQVQVDPNQREVEDQVTYLYNFRLGRSNESFGTNCAAMNGIDPAIIERANEIAALMRRGEDLVAACAKLTPAEMEDLEDAERVARRFLQIDLAAPPQGASEEFDSVSQILSDILGEFSDFPEMVSTVS